jgi:selenium metabolism protein YedF
MKRSIDGRTLPCPQPVIKVKQAFDEGGFRELEVLVDNQAAVENITRFAENSGHNILSVSEDSNISTIIIENLDDEILTAPETEKAEKILSSGNDAAKIFINSSTIGTGEQKLGEKLMEAFIYTLTEMDRKPRHILFMNSGVKVTVEGSSSIQNLRDLERSGVELLICGACLDYYGIKDKLEVGKVSNMYEIATILTGEGNTVTVG